LSPPRSIGAPRLIRSFGPGDPTASPSRLPFDNGAWRLDCHERESVNLFKIRDIGVLDRLLTYRAELRSENLVSPACLELLAHIPGRGELRSKGYHHAFQGDHEWRFFEVSLLVGGPHAPDLLKLNIASEGPGTIWIRNVKLLATEVE